MREYVRARDPQPQVAMVRGVFCSIVYPMNDQLNTIGVGMTRTLPGPLFNFRVTLVTVLSSNSMVIRDFSSVVMWESWR